MDDRFVNPYTFVPLPKGGAKRSDCTAVTEPVFSGEIKCRLITKTQIAVPDILKNPVPDNVERTEPKKYDFFTLDGKAAIPGSGIRGVIRSVYEVLTDSCMHLNDKDHLYTRLYKEKPGIITYDRNQNKYILHESVRLRDKTGKVHRTGEKVSYFLYDAEEKKPEDLIKGYSLDGEKNGVYIHAGPFENSPSPSVFKYISSGKEIDEKYIYCLIENVRMYEGKNAKDHKDTIKEEYESAIREMKTNEGWLPVWYFYDRYTQKYYFAPSQRSRAVFVNSLGYVVEKAGMMACSKSNLCCAACALFGFIGNKSGDSDTRVSHVRFTDAICENPDCFDGSYILPILGEPKHSAFEFYLTGHNDRSFCPDNPDVTIAGRKFYWHAPQNVITSDDEKAKEQPAMANRMQLVRNGEEFTFSVFFDNITDDQLKKLVFALNLGENYAGSARCHKIGHGKPIGLGSVKITVSSITKRSYENGIYSVNDVTEEIVGAANTGMFPPTPEFIAFLTKAVNLNYVAKKNVHYPRTSQSSDIFAWFQKNRDLKRSSNYITIYNHLPRITDADQTLPVDPVPIQKNSSGRNHGGGFNKSHSGFQHKDYRR